MALFAAFLPRNKEGNGKVVLESMRQCFREKMQARRSELHSSAGTHVLLASRYDDDSNVPRYYADESGWVMLAGICFRVDRVDARVELAETLGRFVDGRFEINAFEGAFSMVLWDHRKRRGQIVADQTVQRHLYIAETQDGVIATSSALALARAIRGRVSKKGITEFLGRGALLTPTTLFEGIERLNPGQHAEFSTKSGLKICKHWEPYQPITELTRGEAANRMASIITDRVRRFGQVSAGPVLADLTGGYDSRLVVLALDFAKVPQVATVNGGQGSLNVNVAKRVAERIGVPMLALDPVSDYSNTPASIETCTELLYLTDGNLPFASTYLVQLIRENLADRFSVHCGGIGGDLCRYHPWSHEFTGIGKMRLADVERTLRYRFNVVRPPRGLMAEDHHEDFCDDIRRRIERVCVGRGQPLSTVQQLEAVWLWKMSSHASAYSSAVAPIIQDIYPLLCAGVVHEATTIPWRLKLSTALIRKINDLLCTRGAQEATQYGGTGAPFKFSTIHRSLWQSSRQMAHLAQKVDRMTWNVIPNAFWKLWPSEPAVDWSHLWRTTEILEIMKDPELRSAALYKREGLNRFLEQANDQQSWNFLARMINLEFVCRELNITL